MKNIAQHWQARTPLRVSVLGLLFLLGVFSLLAVLWSRWGLSFWVYIPLAMAVLFLVIKAWWRLAEDTLYFDSVSEFSLRMPTGVVPVRITHVWHSPIALTISVVSVSGLQKKQLVFWRVALASEAWRQLHIYILRYQLQYQFAELKVLNESR